MINENSSLKFFEKYSKWFCWVIPIIAIILYSNTLGHDFTQDDGIVIKENIYTVKGFDGIKDLLINDTFNGFFKDKAKAKIVSGGRYRPLTPVMFAIEYELFGYNPLPGHLFNILSYAFLCFLVFITLKSLFKDQKYGEYIAFFAALIYTIHPLHTEVVANIKSRDEIMAMLGSVGCLWFMIKYVDTKQLKFAVLGIVILFLGLMSKENAITFLAVIPLALFLFRRVGVYTNLKVFLFTLIPTVLFLAVRTSILGVDFGPLSLELMNNPYLKWTGNSYIPFTSAEKLSAILFCFLKYVMLMIFPHPLTHDYYPNTIPLLSFSNISVIMALIMALGLFVFAILNIRKRPIISFSILLFFTTFSIVSNLFFPIGTNMSERFLFMPLLGFSVILGYLMTLLAVKNKKVFYMCFIVLLLGFSFKTVARNKVWKDDFTIFTTDVKTSINSAKVHASVAGTTIDKALISKIDIESKKKMYNTAIDHANIALKLYPLYENAMLLKGNAHFYLEQYDEAIKTYDELLKISPEFKDAFNNKAIALRDKGQYNGEKLGNLLLAYSVLKQSYSMNPNDATTTRLLGVAEGMQGNHQEAIKYFRQSITIEPNNANGFLNLGRAYEFLGKMDSATYFLQKAKELDPNINIGN